MSTEISATVACQANSGATAPSGISENKTDAKDAQGAVTGKVKKLSAKNIKKARVALKWKKLSGIQGYQIRYGTDRKFKKAKMKQIKSNKCTITKLKKKKTYYFQIRAYNIVNGRKVYGTWGNIKKVKISK